MDPNGDGPMDQDDRVGGPRWNQMPGGPDGGGGPPSDDLMAKVRQQQELIDLEKKREAQQKLMAQQQIAMLEAQRAEQQSRMMPGQGPGFNRPGPPKPLMGGVDPPQGPPGSQGPPPLLSQDGPPGLMRPGPPGPMGGSGGPRPLMQTPVRPSFSQGGPDNMGRGPPSSQGGPGLMGDRPPMSQGGPGLMGDRPPMSQGGPGLMGERPPPLMGQPTRPPGPRNEDRDDRPPQDRDDRQKPGQLGPAPYNGPGGQRPTFTKKDLLPPPGPGGPKEIRLAPALEKMLEFKSIRETEIAEIGEEKRNEESDEENEGPNTINEDDEDDEDEAADTISKQTKESKNRRKKKKKKKARRNRFEQQKKTKKKKEKSKAPDVIVEYVQEQPELDPYDPNYHTFAKIFETFKITEPEKPKEVKLEDADLKKKEEAPMKIKGIQEEEDDSDDDEVMPDDDDGPKISKKKLKKLTRLTVAQLKQLVTRPDVVEMHDVTARDPRLLVHLKGTRNSVPVPRHWCYKRKYLQGKRGIEKTPFELPDFIKATGIEEMRAALQEKEDQKTLKSKMREKVRPKMGKIDIDYQKLHDAFFRFQTKPKMTVHGDLYYESKEFETKLREKKPGNLSDDLKMALGMPIGANSEKVPPPWLIAMQRYGPPPSYPNLKIAGLNAPIPEGCMFGYHAGGWGKPPVDEHGKPLYGDVFGTQNPEFKTDVEEEDIDKTTWGELESESESESESEEEEEEDKDETGLITPAEGLMTPGGISSVGLGMETPDQIELRKRRIEDAMDQGGDTPALFQVLPEKKAAPVGGAMMGSQHVYDMAAVAGAKKAVPGAAGGGGAEAVEVSLNPEELDLDTAAMQAKFDQTLREQQGQLEKEDLSDMVAAHAAKQRKRKKAQQDTGKGAKKYKDFKF